MFLRFPRVKWCDVMCSMCAAMRWLWEKETFLWKDFNEVGSRSVSNKNIPDVCCRALRIESNFPIPFAAHDSAKTGHCSTRVVFSFRNTKQGQVLFENRKNPSLLKCCFCFFCHLNAQSFRSRKLITTTYKIIIWITYTYASPYVNFDTISYGL